MQPALLRYLRLITAEPEDVAGETWIHVVTGLRRFRGGEQDFRAWLFTIARNRAADARRSGAGGGVHPGRDGADQVATARTGRDHHAAGGGRPGCRRRGQDRGQDPGGRPGGRASRLAPARRPGRAGGCNTLSGPDAMHGEMPGFFPGRPGGEHDEPLLGMTLERRPIPPGASPEFHGLVRMLAAVAGPAEPGDLAGQDAAHAAFARLASRPGTSHAALRSARRSLSERPARGRLPLAAALAVAAAGL